VTALLWLAHDEGDVRREHLAPTSAKSPCPRIAARRRACWNSRWFAISFDTKGVVAGVQTKTGDDAVPVCVVSRTTQSPGTDATFLQQLLGNIGRFGPGIGGAARRAPATMSRRGAAPTGPAPLSLVWRA
jgi:hypothetical protein